MNISEHVQALSRKKRSRSAMAKCFGFLGLTVPGRQRPCERSARLQPPASGSATVAGICRGLAESYIKVISL